MVPPSELDIRTPRESDTLRPKKRDLLVVREQKCKKRLLSQERA
jgi:hypothetical protein